jgi:PAS domain S-box-containing protein
VSTATSTVPDQRAMRQFKTLYELLAAFSKARVVEEVYEAALSALLDATEAERAAILFFDDDGVMRFKAWRGLSPEYREAVTGHSPWARGQMTAQPIMAPDVSQEQSLVSFGGVFESEGIRALAFVPLELDRGVLGEFVLYYRETHLSTASEIEVAQAIAAHVALAAKQKRAELAQARSERRLEAMLENSATVISLKDLDGRYLLVNRMWEDLFRIAASDSIGRTDRDLFPPGTAEQFRANDLAVLAAGKALAVQENAMQDGGVHTYMVVKFPVREPDGSVSGVFGIATDITERKRLEASSSYLAAIIESSDDAIISKDLNGLITSWNRGAERIFGYRAEEVLGKPVRILAPPDRRDEMPAILAKIRRGERVEHFETRRVRKDGKTIDISLTVSPIRDETGHVIGASKIARDITERKTAERERAELLRREREIRHTAELLNQVGPRLVAQLDLQKLAQEVTDLATALVGAESGAFFQQGTREKGETATLRALSGVSPNAFAESPPELRDDGVVRKEDVSAELFHPHNPIPIRSYLSVPVVAQSKEVLGGLFFGHSKPGQFTVQHEAMATGIAAQAGIAMDNARLFEQAQRVQSELERSNEELRRANRDLEVFAYSASHDLQEPLRTVAISAQLIERSLGNRLQAEEAGFLKEILAAAKRMSGLISDLLAYTKATKYEEGGPPLSDAAQVVNTVLENLGGTIQETGGTVIAGELPAVAMHECRLAQVFQNLIGNALKYRGKEVPCVQVNAGQRDGWIVFSVTDNGIGIEPQYADHIFGLFKRLHTRSEFPGSGIGLAICQRVVEHYGGRIWLDRSAIGGGSTFCFSVPAHA